MQYRSSSLRSSILMITLNSLSISLRIYYRSLFPTRNTRPYAIFIDCLLFFKILSVSTLRTNLENQVFKFEESNPYYIVFSMLGTLMIISHFLAMFWHILLVEELKDTSVKTWLQVLELVDAEWWQRYVWCYYFMLQTIITSATIVISSWPAPSPNRRAPTI